MSSILKALKKLEDEKAAKLGQKVDITKDIFGSARQAAPDFRRPLMIAGVTVAAVVAGMAYFLTAKPKAVPVPPSPPAATVPAAPAEAPPTPPAQPLSQPPQSVSVAPALSPARPAGKGLLSPPRPPELLTDYPAITAAPRAVPSLQTAPAAPVHPPSAPQTLVTVNGIAYNKDAADRLAVINGIPVGEGKTIGGGIRVEEIMPDRVRFSQGNKSFEVAIGRDNQ